MAQRLHLAEHAGLALSALLVVVTAIRLMAVAAFDPQTSVALLQQTGTGTVLVASVLLGAYAAIPMGSGLFAGWLLGQKMRGQRVGGYTYVALAFLVAFNSLAISWAVWLPLFLGLGSYVALPAWRLAPTASRPRPAPSALALARTAEVCIGLIIAGVLLILLVTPNPWMPSERIEPQRGEPFTAYVLKDSDNEYVLLRNEQRAVMRMPRDDVRLRELCRRPQQEDWSLRQRPLGPTLFDIERPSYRPCP